MKTTYQIHNTTRSPQTRTTRRSVPGPESSTKNLFIGGSLRIVRGRPAFVTETFLRRHLRELIDKESKGLVAVTLGSKRLNLQTFEVTEEVLAAPSTELTGEEDKEQDPGLTGDVTPPPPVGEVTEEVPPPPAVEVTETAPEQAPVDDSPVEAAPELPEEQPTAVESPSPFFGGKKKNRR